MLNPLDNARMTSLKARGALLQLRDAAKKAECGSLEVPEYLYITPERLEAYKEQVKKLIRTYDRFIKALYDDGVR